MSPFISEAKYPRSLLKSCPAVKIKQSCAFGGAYTWPYACVCVCVGISPHLFTPAWGRVRCSPWRPGGPRATPHSLAKGGEGQAGRGGSRGRDAHLLGAWLLHCVNSSGWSASVQRAWSRRPQSEGGCWPLPAAFTPQDTWRLWELIVLRTPEQSTRESGQDDVCLSFWLLVRAHWCSPHSDGPRCRQSQCTYLVELGDLTSGGKGQPVFSFIPRCPSHCWLFSRGKEEPSC